MIEPRIYRAAFIPALFALVLVMFSLEPRPSALPQGLAADVLFDARRALQDVRELERTTPDRAPGSVGNERTATSVSRQLAELGFRTEIDRFKVQERSLINVVARRGGGSPSQVVVIAARDGDSVPDSTSSGADTAALVELARVFEGKVSNKTLVLASVDGSTLGDAGARRLADQLDDGPETDAVLVLSNMGARESGEPLVFQWSNDSSRGGIGLERTAVASLRQEVGDVPEDGGFFRTPSEVSRLAFPLGIGGQGPLLAKGIDAIRLSGSGELPPADADRAEDIDPERFEDLGRGALRTVFALEEGDKPEHGPSTYVHFAGQVLPGWALSLFTLFLIIPALVASVDAFARARRRREAVGPYWRWLGAAVLAFAAAYLVGEFLVLVGQAPDPPPGPPSTAEADIGGDALGALIATSFALALGLVLARTRVLRREGWPPPAGAPGAACAVSLALAFAVLFAWLDNPYGALILLPALHLWMLATLTRVSARAAAIMYALGALPVLIVALLFLGRLDLGPLEGTWYFFQLVTGGHVGVLSALLGCVLLGVAVSAAGVVLAKRGIERDEPRRRPGTRPADGPSIFGPGGHAGPGMLGGPLGGRGRGR